MPSYSSLGVEKTTKRMVMRARVVIEIRRIASIKIHLLLLASETAPVNLTDKFIMICKISLYAMHRMIAPKHNLKMALPNELRTILRVCLTRSSSKIILKASEDVNSDNRHMIVSMYLNEIALDMFLYVSFVILSMSSSSSSWISVLPSTKLFLFVLILWMCARIADFYEKTSSASKSVLQLR